MNKAFTREPDAEADSGDDEEAAAPALPAGSKNYLTPAGYRRLRD
jgi:transcription elongation factor GreB